jgi:hypothetical protein
MGAPFPALPVLRPNQTYAILGSAMPSFDQTPDKPEIVRIQSVMVCGEGLRSGSGPGRTGVREGTPANWASVAIIELRLGANTEPLGLMRDAAAALPVDLAVMSHFGCRDVTFGSSRQINRTARRFCRRYQMCWNDKPGRKEPGQHPPWPRQVRWSCRVPRDCRTKRACHFRERDKADLG